MHSKVGQSLTSPAAAEASLQRCELQTGSVAAHLEITGPRESSLHSNSDLQVNQLRMRMEIFYPKMWIIKQIKY